MKKATIDTDLNVGKSSRFEDLYFALSEEIVSKGDKVPSRNGNTLEFLNFKTIVVNPRARCVGGYGRDINIFFLLAEAMWIWCGRKDVEFLNIFNSNMAQFSDDGESFHAPYGFRIRSTGSSSFPGGQKGSDKDQLYYALNALNINKEDRRVVISIWNPDLDLGIQSKDLPCNDMLMFKIRNGMLYQTIQNRSNDLHWGLPTNVFQFSFIGEVMANILDVELGEQIHNSQSLHCYLDNELTGKISDNVGKSVSDTLYQIVDNRRMDLKFSSVLVHQDIFSKVKMVDELFSLIMDRLLRQHKGEDQLMTEEDFIKKISSRSDYFVDVYKILKIYIDYIKLGRTDEAKVASINNLIQLGNKEVYDYLYLSINWFASKMKNKDLLLEDSYQLTGKDKSLGKL